VDAQGNVFLPNVGPIPVAGTKNAELTAKMRAGLGRVYARNFEVYTNLLTAKPVAVFVTGGVKRPGRYAGVPSDSALFFLEQAGGIDPRLGSYRNISVLRAGQKLAELDLYDFFSGRAEDLFGLALAATGAGGQTMNIALRATPTIQTPIGPIRYPSPITIVHRDVEVP
jgi:protein involved in polysaccharide export with SLBB domain